MVLKQLELLNFRNFEHVVVAFGDFKNFLIGKNAQGKTNILEAIYILCLSKSFRTNIDQEAIRFSEDHYIIKGNFETDSGNRKEIAITYSIKHGKIIVINHKRLHSTSELIGDFPVVLSSPDEYIITSGPPINRRKFIDILLSQLNKQYFLNLIDYNRILQQRNKVLLSWKTANHIAPSIIEPWNENLIRSGSKIIEYRHHFSLLFSDRLTRIYSDLSDEDEKLTFEYKTNIMGENEKEINNCFREKLAEVCYQEQKRGISLIGPHRDDFEIKINGKDVRKYGSRGQHKTVLIALALAQFQILKEKLGETPLMLIDDLYSEIDDHRRNRILDSLAEIKQVFITATLPHEDSSICNRNKFYIIDSGTVKPMNHLIE